MYSIKEILLSGELASMVQEATKGERLDDPQKVFNILKPLVSQHQDIEKVYCIFLDAKHQVISIDVVASGSIGSCHVYTREVLKRIISLGARSIILSHNHPSGDTEPSREDFDITKKLMSACYSIDVTLLDHIIIGRNFYSMADIGKISAFQSQITNFYNERN